MANFSCYVTIINNTLATLWRNDFGQSYGYWKTNPPSEIVGQTSSIQMQLSDSTGPAGSTGWITYKILDDVAIKLNFDCPFTGSNSFSQDLSGQNNTNYKLSYRAKSGSGSWQDNSCPSGGHPLYVEVTVAQVLPRRLTPDEESILQNNFPNLDMSNVWVLGERTDKYNCIAWSLGINYAWINPPSSLSEFETLYKTAADSVHSKINLGYQWKAHSNWQSISRSSSDGTVDGWGINENEMTHGSRLMKSCNFPNGNWTSKLGNYLLISHNREELNGNTYGNILTSFKQLPTPATLAAMKNRHLESTEPTFFSEEEYETLNRKVEAVSPEVVEKFKIAYKSWIEAIDKKIPFSSDTRDGAKLEEFKTLTDMGSEILPLVVSLIVLNPSQNFRATILYDALQKDGKRRVLYAEDDSYLFEGEASRSARSAKLWLSE